MFYDLPNNSLASPRPSPQQAVYSVFKKDSNICSLRVLETGLNICELLLDLGAKKMSEHAHKLAMGIMKRALLHLGCPHGCNDGIRGPPAEFLRTQCHTILSRMLRTAAPMSRNYLRDMVRTTPLHELVEFFHAFVGFCVDPSSLLSPLSKLNGGGVSSALMVLSLISILHQLVAFFLLLLIDHLNKQNQSYNNSHGFFSLNSCPPVLLLVCMRCNV